MFGKVICYKCNGNGYRSIWKDTSETEKVTIDCKDLEPSTMMQ
jgi:hypothetical protein